MRTAPAPDETVHVDLALVPATHAPAEPIPAVSSSSGQPGLCPPAAPLHYGPGQVCADPAQSDEQAMNALGAASAIPPAERPPAPSASTGAQRRAERRAVQREQAQVRAQRRRTREARSQHDAEWRATRAARRVRQAQRRRGAPHGAGRALEEVAWRAARAARAAQQAERLAEDGAWRAQQRALQERASGLATTMAWIAVLVVDSSTRRCLGLPVFASGAHVTAAQVVAALRELLPAELQDLVTDRGTHCTAEVFKACLGTVGVTHVRTARHRPQSNGIAERFVRTFKEWLADKEWTTSAEVGELLAEFRTEYNERTHQGRGLDGLSPHECGRRKGVVAAA